MKQQCAALALGLAARASLIRMAPGPPRTPPLVVALVVLAALGACMVAAAGIVPGLLGHLGAWPVFVAGFLALLASLAGLWVTQKRRDRTLR